VSLPSVDFLAVGHVTLDEQPDGGQRLGGAVTYAAVTAAALGLRAGVVTRAEPHLAALFDFPGVALHLVPAETTTTFVNAYDDEHRRRQAVLALAPPLAPSDVPPEWRRVPVAHFGIVGHELGPDVMDAVEAGFRGLGPQGWLRHFTVGDDVIHGRWHGPEGLLARADAVLLSEEDLAGERRGADWFRERSEVLVVTAGRDGARAYRRDEAWHQPSIPAAATDPTGAGDAFAAGFVIHLAETGDVPGSLRFAAAVAAFAVEHPGPGGIPGRPQIEQRARG